MSIKKFFNQQFRLQNFLFHHNVTSDFYLSCFQRNQSTVPVLILRTLIFVGCLSIWIASMALTTSFYPVKFWTIYMTHWGLILNTITSGFGLMVSVMASLKKPIELSTRLPWYIQAYWVMFSLSTPIALFITVFYWTLLSGEEEEFAVNFTLDVFIHAVNSILMSALLISSRQPTNFLHFYIPVGFATVYLIFSYVYYALGGTDAFGYHTIYPMIDWERPGETVGIAVACMLGITILHGLVVAISAGRDILTRPLKNETTTFNVHGAY